MHRTLIAERTLTAGVAHELHPPPAGLHAQAQWAQRAANAGERAAAPDQLIAAAARYARRADAVPTLARLDAARFDPTAQPPLALADFADLLMQDVQHAAFARRIALETDLQPLTPRVEPDALAIALTNLLGTAVHYGRRCMRLEARAPPDGRALLAVRDDGPDVPPAERQRLFDRFFRGDGADNGTGSGLGLALVKRVAKLHGGSIA